MVCAYVLMTANTDRILQSLVGYVLLYGLRL
jgi:hypothetical protein